MVLRGAFYAGRVGVGRAGTGVEERSSAGDPSLKKRGLSANKKFYRV